jgi:hypothetical protein
VGSAELVTLTKAWTDAMNAKDHEKLEALMAPEFALYHWMVNWRRLGRTGWTFSTIPKSRSILSKFMPDAEAGLMVMPTKTKNSALFTGKSLAPDRAEGQARTFEMGDVQKIVGVSSPAISPDGKSIDIIVTRVWRANLLGVVVGIVTPPP